MPTRKASAAWEGGLKTGKGNLRTETGAAAGAYNFSGRFEQGTGTNPEELLAASYAACFSMALSGGIEKAGKTPQKIETDAACTVEPKEGGGFRVSKMQLVVRAKVDGMSDDEFQTVAAATKDGCPIAGVMKNNVEVTLDAKLV